MHGSPRLYIWAAVACSALTAATAQARVPRAELHDALAVAAQKWGAVCTAPPTAHLRGLRSDTLGMATWDGMWDVPSDERDGCRILLNSHKGWDWDRLCTTVVHEWGHLAGHGHSDEPGSPMDPSYAQPYGGCVRARAARRWP